MWSDSSVVRVLVRSAGDPGGSVWVRARAASIRARAASIKRTVSLVSGTIHSRCGRIYLSRGKLPHVYRGDSGAQCQEYSNGL